MLRNKNFQEPHRETKFLGTSFLHNTTGGWFRTGIYHE